MKIDRLAERVEKSGEALFGPENAGMLTTYMIYGRLAARETGRRLQPGQGREEILFVVNGQVRLEVSGYEEVLCDGGTAISLPEGTDCWLSNTTPNAVQYVIAGGFTQPAHFLNQVQQAQKQANRS